MQSYFLFGVRSFIIWGGSFRLGVTFFVVLIILVLFIADLFAIIVIFCLFAIYYFVGLVIFVFQIDFSVYIDFDFFFFLFSLYYFFVFFLIFFFFFLGLVFFIYAWLLRWVYVSFIFIIPYNVESRHPWLLCQYVSHDVVHLHLLWRVLPQLFAVILVIHIVAYSHKLPAVVRAAQQDHSNADQLAGRDQLSGRRVRREHELIHTDRDGAHQDRVQLLVVLERPRGPDVGQFPLQIILQWLQTLESDLKLVRISELSRVVQHFYTQ